MKKRSISIISVALVLSLIPSLASADIKVSLKLQGGWAYLKAGDVNPATQNLFDWAVDNSLSWINPNPAVLSRGGVEALHGGYEVGGDVIFEFSRNFGVGIGGGYLQASRTSTGAIEIVGAEGVGAGVRADPKLSAIPLRIGVFLTLPLRGKINLIANAGVGYYFRAKCRAGWSVGTDLMDTVGPSNQVSTLAEKKKNAFGFQGGLGIEYTLSSRIALLIEANGRYARFRGLEGTSMAVAGHSGLYGEIFPPFSENGKLYYESVPMILGSPRLIMVQSAPPAGPGGQPREAVVDFSGVSLQAGIRIHF